MRARSGAGLSLIEVMVAVFLIGTAVAAVLTALPKIQRSLQKSKARSLATMLCRDMIETLKSKPYALLRPTTQADLTAYGYDNTYWPPEIGLRASRLSFDRFNRVTKATLDAAGALQDLSPASPDAGLKKIEVWVEWDEEGQRRRYSMSTLYTDPKRVRPTGTILGVTYKEPGGFSNVLPGVRIFLEEEPARLDVSDMAGGYAVQAPSGTYTLRASKRGFFPGSAVVTAAPDANQDFVLAPRGTGTISGYAYLRDHMVISQVVVSTVQADGYDVQYVELYNPTTAAVFVGDALSHDLRLRYRASGQDCGDIGLVYVSTFAAPHSYYLIANTTGFAVVGTTAAADAYFSDTAAAACASVPLGWSPPMSRRIFQPGQEGSLILRGPGGPIDSVGWMAGAAAPPSCEGSCAPLPFGLNADEQLVRLSSPTAAPGAPQGRAYDTGDNASDFAGPPALPAPLGVPPLGGWAGPRPPVTGTPAVGANVAADDDVSSPVVILSTAGYFELPGAATCTVAGAAAAWNLSVSSRGYWGTLPVSAPPPAGVVDAGVVALVSEATGTFVTGAVRDPSANPIAGIVVFCSGYSAVTDAAGAYALLVSSGTGLQVTANYGHAAPGYSSETSTSFDAPAGGAVAGVNLTLTPVGIVSGRVTSDGVSPLPGVVVRAEAPPGASRGFTTSDPAGAFRLEDLPASALAGVGSYSISVVPDSSQTSSPASFPATIAQGAEVFVGTFTVLSAMGAIAGSVLDGGQPIATGVLILATQETVGAVPPDWNESLRTGSTFYYSVYAASDGSYKLPVRVSSTPYNVYAWYSKPSPAGSVTSQKSATQVVDSSSSPFTMTFTWP